MAKTLIDFGIIQGSDPNDRGEAIADCPECAQARKNKGEPLVIVFTPTDAVWLCYHCGWAGSLGAGIKRRSDPGGWMSDEWTRPELRHKREWSKEQRDYMHLRGISDATIERNQLTIQHVWMPKAGTFANAVAFPFYRSGELVNIKYRARNKDMRLAKNAELIFYGLDDITYQMDSGEIVPQDLCYIVEGELDKLAMDEAGFTNTISVPNGAASPATRDLNKHLQYIENSNFKLHADDEQGLLDRIGTFVIAVDSDEAGQRLQDELIRRLGRERCAILRWPKWPLDKEELKLWDGKKIKPGDTLKDANEVLFALGIEGVQAAARAVKPIRMDGIYRVSDFEAELDDYYDHGLPPGVSLPWKAFRTRNDTDAIQVKKQTTWVVTGIPGHGKSRWIENVCVELARKEDWRIAYFSPEVNPKQLHASYLLSQWAGQPFNKGETRRMDREMYEAGKKWLDDHFFWMETDTLPFGIDDLLDRATKLVRKFGISGVVIDPWNNVDHSQSRKSFEREDEYIGRALQRINAWRSKNDMWFAVVAHPTKLKAEKGKEPVASLTDVKGGAEWFSMADFGFSVWRDRLNENVPTQVHIQKVKFQHLGTMGMAQMRFDKPTSKFYDAEIGFDGVRAKETNHGDDPRFDAPEIQEEEPYWMRGKDYDL